ncbi:MAG: acyl-CoA synthetase [Pacificimonas sp.]|nr:acyl-CoA synthetase [Pacificimonas sp.]
MHPFVHAENSPDKPAIIMADGSGEMSYAELEAASNRAAQFFRSQGLTRGDSFTLLLENCIEYLPIAWGAQRAGLMMVPMSTKLGVSEAQYIIDNSDSQFLIADASLGGVASKLKTPKGNFVMHGDLDGFTRLEPLLAEQPPSRIEDESSGRYMLYSSGTTGQPKGITGPLPEEPIDAPNPLVMLTQMLFGFGPDIIYLSPAPMYHAAPLGYTMTVHKHGGTVVMMRKFDPEQLLANIEKYQITHMQVVPTMFVRMLKLPEDIRAKYDVSSVKAAIHAAAPCPVEVKRRMIEWWGPVIYEYYSASEGTGFTAINPEEWMQKQGSVGKSFLGEIRILDEDDNPLPPGREGRVYFAGAGEIQYHKDPDKSASVQHKEHGSTFGDIGYVDEDGYLFLTDRAAYMIISGGVNVYPQEAEDVLVMHPKVQDVAVIGVPHEEFGEEVKAVVQPREWADAGPDLEAELIAFVRERLSHVKCPRSVDFEQELPRHDTGKLYKRLLKDRYWAEARAAG